MMQPLERSSPRSRTDAGFDDLAPLAGRLAHDFNNLLVVVLGYTRMARKEIPPSSPAGALLDHVEETAYRAAELARRLMTYAGQGHLVRRPVDLSALLHDLCEPFENAVSRRTRLRFALRLDAPLVAGDVSELRHVLLQLVRNAADAIGDSPGVITLRTGVVEIGEGEPPGIPCPPELEKGLYVFAAVSDSGGGMNEETLEHAFDPFATARHAYHCLGLSTMLGILRSHGGTLTVESTPERGTTVRIFLPMLNADASGTVPAEAIKTFESCGRGLPPGLPPEQGPHRGA